MALTILYNIEAGLTEPGLITFENLIFHLYLEVSINVYWTREPTPTWTNTDGICNFKKMNLSSHSITKLITGFCYRMGECEPLKYFNKRMSVICDDMRAKRFMWLCNYKNNSANYTPSSTLFWWRNRRCICAIDVVTRSTLYSHDTFVNPMDILPKVSGIHIYLPCNSNINIECSDIELCTILIFDIYGITNAISVIIYEYIFMNCPKY